MKENLREIASHFALEGPVTAIDSLGEGFINDTFIVRTEADAPDYILQRKNKAVFPDVPAMMDNIRRVTEHIRRRVIAAGGDPRREVMTVVPAKDGHLYHVDAEGEYWAATVFIDDTVAYNKADSPELARKGGEGIGKFQSQLDDFTEPLAETIKGFHNIRHRFGQWDAALARDAAGGDRLDRVAARRDALFLVEGRGRYDPYARDAQRHEDQQHPVRQTGRGALRHRPRHGDGLHVAQRFRRRDPLLRQHGRRGRPRVGISLEMFSAYTDGYLSLRAAQLTDTEIGHLAFSARYITFEQVLRFLMDYIDGDTYYKIKYPDHNLVRTHAQYRLLQSMEEHYGEMCRIVDGIAAKYRNA